MNKRAKLKIAFWVTAVFGIGCIVLGIVLPFVISDSVDSAIHKIWLKPDDYDTWGEIPGKSESEIYKGYKLYNITNPEEVLQGAKPIVVETPNYYFQEITKYVNWTYQDDQGNEYGEDVTYTQNSDDYIAFKQNTRYWHVPNNDTYMDPTTPLTIVNTVTQTQAWYGLFYGLSHQQFPLFSLHNMFDVKWTFQNDFYYMILAYSAYNTRMKDTDAMKTYLTGAGFTTEQADAILADTIYGWGSWKAIKQWFEAYSQYQITGSAVDGTFDLISNNLQIPNLVKLLGPAELIAQLSSQIQTDMVSRYGTSDKDKLGILQWNNSTVTLNLPLDQGMGPLLPGTSFPTFIALNQTFNFLPELNWAVAAIGYPAEDYYNIADTLLQTAYTYPMDNYYSIMNIQNIGTFFSYYAESKYTQIKEYFRLERYTQIDTLAAYLNFIAYLPIDTEYDGSKTCDSYSMILSRFSRRNLVDIYNKMLYDSTWALYARSLFCNYAAQGVTCQTIISYGSDLLADSVCTNPSFGWDIGNPETWGNLIWWAEAAMKGNESQAYFHLTKTNLSTTELDQILYLHSNSISSSLTQIAQLLSTQFKCTHSTCTYHELLYLQWGSSYLTMAFPQIFTTCNVLPTKTLSDWRKDRYTTPGEWTYYFDAPIDSSLATQLINYEAFLNPTTLRVFYNLYFKGDPSATAQYFGFPSVAYVELLYSYLLKIIPGFSLFVTRTFEEHIMGYYDPFNTFLHSMNEYEGGYPMSSPYWYLVADENSQEYTPRHVIYSGKDDASDTSQYYEYFGSKYQKWFGASYCAFCPYGVTYRSADIWARDIELEGSNGGVFGINISKDDTLAVYVTGIWRSVELKYEKQHNYKSLNVYKYVVPDYLLKNSDEVPENADFYQYPHGYKGTLNYTSVYGFPSFYTLGHGYLAEPKFQEMVDYYAYTPDDYLSMRILPEKEHDESYADIEPLTGVGVGVVLNLHNHVVIYRDQFFKQLHEPVFGKGLFLPYSYAHRSMNYTKSRIDDVFDSLVTARQISTYGFYFGIIVGSCLTLMAFGLLILIYKARKDEEKAIRKSKLRSERELFLHSQQ